MPATIAVIAHDSKKEEIVNFVKKRQTLFSRYQLMATGTTGERLQRETGLAVECMLSGPEGGDAQIAAQVAQGKVAAVIFLLDPLSAQPHEPKIHTLQRLCGLHNVPLATNIATAAMIAECLRQTCVAHLIFNPISGQGNAEEDLQLIKQLLEPKMKVVVHLTTPETTAQELTQQAIASQADIIIASGGDGTVSVVAGEIIGTDIPLGIVPRGTANAFAVALGIPARLTPIRSSCEIILKGNTSVVDAARCNGLPMILLAGIGFEAETVERADREIKNRLGAFGYIMAGIQQFNEQELFETEIEIEGVVKKFQAGAVTIANAAPSTSVMAQGLGQVDAQDGVLDVTIAAPQGDLQAVNTMVNLLGAALLNQPTNREDIINFQTKQVKVTTDPPQKVVLDGEIIGTTPVEVTCIPEGLTVITPPNAFDS
ncbi:MAG: methylglyoxal synthase [Okeania sp. SIO2D1]|nr:methylglyoxal synthase [Okeania sp. SIO2D1]